MSMTDKQYDVVIVGAGIAGGLVALELGRAGKRVLIVEAGPAIPADRKQYLDNFYRAAAKTPEAPYPPLPDASGQPVDPATLNTPRVTILRENDYADPSKSYLTYGKNARPFGSTYERVGGGTTWHWSGTCLRLFPNSFRMQSAYQVAVNWPIGYDDLASDYDRANELIGVAGSRQEQESLGLPFDADFPMPPVPLTRVDEAFKAADGVTVDDAPNQKLRVTATPQGRNTVPYPPGNERRVCAGNTNCIPICPIQAKYDATVTLNDAFDTGNVDILYQSVATRVNVGGNGNVTGIDYVQWQEQTGPPTGRGTAVGKKYVLAAHAIETPKLLLNSRTDALPDGVANGSGQVGCNLMDHVMFVSWAQTKNPVWPYRGPLATSGFESLRDGDFRRDRAAWRIEIGNEGWNWAKNDPYWSVIDFVDGLNRTNTNKFAHRKRLSGPELYQALNWNLTRQVRLGFLIEQDPVASMKVTLDPEGRTDHLGIPRPHLEGYGISDYTARGFLSAQAASRKIWAAMGAKDFTEPVDPEKVDISTGPYFQVEDDQGKKHTFRYYGAGHIMGTYCMGAKGSSVLNARQQSWEHDNLFMVGSGVFPTTGTANPTLTIAALALRAAREIGSDLDRGV